MRSRRLSAFLGIATATFLVVVACEPFEADLGPATDAPTADAAPDGPFVPLEVPDASAVPNDAGLFQPSVGTPCARQASEWRVCVDFETQALDVRKDGSGAKSELFARDGGVVLRSTIGDDTEGFSYHRVPIGPNATRVIWAFDFHIDDDVQDSTEFGSLDLPFAAPGDLCVIELERVPNKIRLAEYCRLGGTSDTYELASVPMASDVDAWFNARVDADLATKTASFIVRDATGGSIGGGSGTLLRAAPSASPYLRVGLAFAEPHDPGTTIELDNAVAWWSP